MGSPLRSPLREGHPAASDSSAFSSRSNPPPPDLPAPAREQGRPTPSSPFPPATSPVPFAISSRSLESPTREKDGGGRHSPVPLYLPSPREDAPVRSPAREEDRSTRVSHVPRLSSLLLQESPAPSPARDDGRPAGPVAALPQKGQPTQDGVRSAASPSDGEADEKPPPPASSFLNRAARDEPKTVTKVERGIGGARDGTEAARGFRPASWIMRQRRMEEAVGRAAVGVRLSAVVLSLVSFSVMASDKTMGWAGDSFDRYREYRFCITMNVLVFIYSGFQAYAQAHRLMYQKDIIRPPLRYYFDFATDQVLAYLLMAASSAAATRTDDWVSDWGSDPFTVKANGSTAISFLTFIAVAISALISASSLFSRRT